MADSVRFNASPPKEALDWFRAKGYKVGFDYRDVWRQEHSHAFTVAKAMRMDVLTSIRESLDEALEQGKTFAQFKQELQPTLEDLGWWGQSDLVDPATGEGRIVQLGSPRRLKTIYDTNMRTARAAGQWERIQRNKKTHPYLVYELGPSEHHRREHASWAGIVLPIDHPFWKTHFAPNGWGCLCRIRQVSRREMERLVASGRYTSQAPKITYKEWINDRTGEVQKVPTGIDPGWDYNPGTQRGQALKQHQARSKKAMQKKLAEPVPSANMKVFPDGEHVLSTAKNVTQQGIAEVLNRIPGAEDQVAKVAAFLEAKQVKSLMIKQVEMGKGKAAWALEPRVKEFLAGTIPPSMVRGSYYTRNAATCGGFTSNAFEHVVVKVKTGDNLKKVNGESMAKAVEVAIESAEDDRTRDWGLTTVYARLESGKTPDIVSTWLHELGHQVHYWGLSPEIPAGAKTITQYSRTNKYEWHAEHFVAWVTNRKALAAWDESIAKHFDDLMERAINSTAKRR